MNRFRKAWLALTGRLEPEVREVEKQVDVLVPVSDSIVTVYQATSKEHDRALHSHLRAYMLVPFPKPPSWHGKLYWTCADAFAVGGADANVAGVSAFIGGNKAFLLGKLTATDMPAKPKRAKGRA